MKESGRLGRSGFYAAGAACAACAVLYLLIDTAAVRAASEMLAAWAAGEGAGARNALYERRQWAATLFTGALALIVPVVVVACFGRLTWRQLGLRRPHGQIFPAALLLYLGASELLNLLAASVGEKTGSMQSYILPRDGGARALAFLSICVAPAILEELLFRGAARTLLRPYGAWFAIWGQAVIFALLHKDASAIVFALPVGLYFGWLAEITGSLLPGMLLHFINNILAYSMLLLSAFGLDSVAGVLSAAEMVIFPLFGVGAAVWFMKKKNRPHPMQKGIPPWRLLKCIPWILCAGALLAYDIFAA